MNSLAKVFDNVPDCVGYLIMNEDGSIEHSHGDLQNNENTANLIYKMFEIPRAQLVEQLRVHLTRVRQRIQES
ncbi:unnamed protein product [Rotaria sordida]|uniref:Uncharacterized protein n=1 Tax=Rotaria sordida TaxID=392033 RepID=A0A815SB13_9BILA|nr:unnamed protein product [Rotaria sordida]